MDIRTKLALALVTVSLASMWLLGFFAYQASADLLQEISERQLGALAESKAGAVSKVIEGWRDRVSLIASRTQLRLDVDAYNTTANETLRASLDRIVADAQSATPSVEAIAVYAAAGERLVESGRVGLLADAAASAEQTAGPEIDYLGAVKDGDDWYIRFASPLTLGGKTIGRLYVAIGCDDLRTVAQDYTGLGELGETLIVQPDGVDSMAALHPLRHADAPEVNLAASAYLSAAIAGTEAVFTDDQVDYRGHRAWAATRFIPEVNWGLAVQVDQLEEVSRVHELRDDIINLGLSLSAFAILGGSLLGIYLARPLIRLANLVDRVRRGETHLRAEAQTDDEIGRLGQALNEFLDGVPPTRESR